MNTEAMEHLNEIQEQISQMSNREKLVNSAVVMLGQVLLTLINNLDLEALGILKEMTDDLFRQAESILKQTPKNLQ